MDSVCRMSVTAAIALGLMLPCNARAQTPQQTPPAPGAQSAPPQQKPEKPEEPEQPKYEETVVVSASRTEEKLVNAPATMTVITAPLIERAPTQNFADLLRTVPGLNITQVSARDINVTSRAATGTLATGQLALLDGRSLYQDFFGFVMWDFLPVNLNEIKQVEVIRGPASAVWGANAVYGVVNVITKSPREMQGTSAVLGVGAFERTNGQNAGSLWYVSGTHAQAVNDRWSYKLSGGGYSQDPLSRPTGIIPGSPGAGTPYPAYTNTGTTQPKFDARVDYDYATGAKLTLSGGASGTEGIMHSGIGPFDIKSGTYMTYARAAYNNKGFHAAAFTQHLDGDAANLLTRKPPDFTPITFSFKTNTVDLEVSNVQTFAQRHVVNYGGNLRYNTFDLSLAPLADNRTEFGVYGQDEIFLSKYLRWTLGARLDRFDYINDVVLSPRTALLIKPQEDHTIRLSYNRAYRSPSVINNFLNVPIAEPINLGLINPALAGRIYALPVQSTGNPDLNEITVDAYEIGYTAVVRSRTVISAAFYVNKTKDDILFTEELSGRWTATNPPPGWPLPPVVISLISGGQGLPGLFTYKNFGKTTQKGLELGVDTSANRYVSFFANYSYQPKPKPEGFDISELNLPPKNRFNAGTAIAYGRFLGNLSAGYTDSAFWQDVLDARYHGTTESYTIVNAGFGVKWAGDKVTTSVKATNLGNRNVQQHVFGDITKRQVVGELKVQF